MQFYKKTSIGSSINPLKIIIKVVVVLAIIFGILVIVSKINFPNNNFGASIVYFENDGLYELALTNSFGRFITGNGAEYKYSCTLAEINSYLRIWSEY